MNCAELMFDKDVISSLKKIWNFTKLNQTIEPCDVIFACGCSNLDIPVRCAELFKQGYGKKILFADDDPEIREALRLLLNCEGYETVEAASGEEALLLMDHTVDLVILDVMMPKMNGYTICAEIRKQCETPIAMIFGF